MRRTLALAAFVLAAGASGGCLSTSLATTRITPDACFVDPDLVGRWTDRRMTPLGPAWLAITFDASCRATYRIQLLWFRYHERSQFWTD